MPRRDGDVFLFGTAIFVSGQSLSARENPETLAIRSR
jgi:hypothetical protein